jgi:hypothetical protein
MKKLVLPHKLLKDLDTGKVTAGLPAVDPFRRALNDTAGYKREWQEANIAEALRKQTDPIRDNAGRPRDSVEAMLGRPMTGHEVKKRIRKLNPSIIVKSVDSLKAYAIYLPNHDKNRDEWAEQFYIGRMEMGLMPESEVVPGKTVKRIDPSTGGFYFEKVVDEDPKRLLSEWKRGWRTIVSRLVKAGAFSREAADRAFGMPSFANEYWAAHRGDR